MPDDRSIPPRQGILSINIKSKNELYAAYMPFVKNGGLFVPTTRSYQVGDDIFMVLTFMDDPERLPVAGRSPRPGSTGSAGGGWCGSWYQRSQHVDIGSYRDWADASRYPRWP